MCLPCAAPMRACLLCVTMAVGVARPGAESIFVPASRGTARPEGRFLHASIHEKIHRPGVLEMWSIDVDRKFGHRKIWNVYNDTRARTITARFPNGVRRLHREADDRC